MTHTLPGWIESLLGIQTETGEAVAWRLEYWWDWPAWVGLAAAAAAVVLIVVSYLRENPRAHPAGRMALAGVRLIVLGLAAVMLAQWTLLVQRIGLPCAVLLVDDSLSMTTVDRYEEPLRKTLEERVRKAGFEQPSRWNLLRTLLAERDGALLASLLDRYKLRVYYLTGPRLSPGADLQGLLEELRTTEPRGKTSPLGNALRTVLADLRASQPAAVLILSDGITTEGPSLGEAAAYAGVPLHLIGLGDDRPERDLKLTDLLVDEVVFVGDVVYFEAKLSAVGYRGRQVELLLRRHDDKQVLARLPVTIQADNKAQKVLLPYRPDQQGTFRFVLEVDPLEGELRTDNNRQERTVQVRQEKVRVLLVAADPSYEFRYLSIMLARDRTIELKTVLQNADLQHAEQDQTALPKGVPVRSEELAQFDVVILVDANPELWSPSMIQNLVDFVEQPNKGGALIAVAGPKYMPLAWRNTPLARLLPIELATARHPVPSRPLSEGFRVQPTELGLASPGMQLADTPEQTEQTWRQLPPLYWMLEAPDCKPAARVLAEHPSLLGRNGHKMPIILMQYVGAGKVLFHATDETWRWRWRTGDLYFARYWVQTIRYLARSKLKAAARAVSLSTDRARYARGEPIRLRVRFADERLAPSHQDQVTVALEHQGHPTRRLQLQRSDMDRGLFEAVLSDALPGSYHAWLAAPALEGHAPAVDFSVALPGEFDRLQMDSQDMRQAAQKTAGRFYTLRSADQLLDELPEGHRVAMENPSEIPLWNSPVLLGAVLLLLVAEWVLRKIAGMV